MVELELYNITKLIKETEQAELTDTDCDNDDTADTRSDVGTVGNVEFRVSVKDIRMPETMEVTIRWRGEAGEVKLAGEFNNWIPEATERQEDGSWSREVSLAPGKYMYKFVVDGEWVVNMELPSVVDQEGNTNNVMEVEDSASDGGSGDSDSWEKVSIPETSAVEEQSSPEDKVEDPMTSSISAGSNMQKISVVERVYSMPASTDYEKIISDNKANFCSTQTSTRTYLDTKDSFFQRKAIWLEKILKIDCTTWKLTTIDKNRLKVFENVEEITEIVQEVLKTTAPLDKIVSYSLIEVTTKNMSVSKWSLGDLELEVQKEDGLVTSITIREVGDLVTALKNIEAMAQKLQCVPFNSGILPA